MSDFDILANASAPDRLISPHAGLQYWESVAADVDGMLGGIPQISKADLQDSRAFLAKLGIGSKGGRRRVRNVLEGGAGIGRVTEGLLLPIATNVDVIEPVVKFTAALQAANPGVRRVFNVGLEAWQPFEDEDEDDDAAAETGASSDAKQKQQTYDLVWIQWCVGHLTDAQLVRCLERCRAVLTEGEGVIVVKENLSLCGSDEFDETDSSVTREDAKFRQIFQQAGLRIVRKQQQKRFLPVAEGRLLPIMSYALKPMAS